jgi:hypothetical protein
MSAYRNPLIVKTLVLSALIQVWLPMSFAAQSTRGRITTPEYISRYKDDAIRDMMKMGVPASITLAQGILESESGNSDLARYANNHFGIKCHKDWTGDTYHKDDDAKDECFRKYRTVLESFDDHGRFLRERPRYAFLFDFEITDYKAWAHGLKKAGYATNPRYAELLIKLIEEHQLHLYDKGGRNMPVTGQPQLAAAPAPAASGHDKHAGVRGHKKGAESVLYNAHEVPYVIAGKGDSWLSVAMAHDLRMWQLLKYNDASGNTSLREGEVVYLKPKRGKPGAAQHVVSGNETLRDISQQYGVKLKTLVKVNHFEESIILQPGQVVRLK